MRTCFCLHDRGSSYCVSMSLFSPVLAATLGPPRFSSFSTIRDAPPSRRRPIFTLRRPNTETQRVRFGSIAWGRRAAFGRSCTPPHCILLFGLLHGRRAELYRPDGACMIMRQVIFRRDRWICGDLFRIIFPGVIIWGAKSEGTAHWLAPIPK